MCSTNVFDQCVACYFSANNIFGQYVLDPSLADALAIGQLGTEQTGVVVTAIRAARSVANK